jgi:beta-lactamase regulating signal transducer with metallopeptidase domain
MNGIMSAIENLCDTVDPLTAATCAAFLALFLGAIDLLFRRWLTAGQMGLMWSVVLLRLLLPVAPSSPFSLERLVELFDNATVVENDVKPPAVKAALQASAPVAVPPNNAVAPPLAADVALPSDGVTYWANLIFPLLPPLWFAVGISTIVWTLTRQVHFCRRVQQAPRCDDHRLLNLWATCCRSAGVHRPGTIVVFDGVDQPAIMGLFRRTLLLPSDAVELTDDQLRMVMLHELAHVRRWDIAANWLLVAIRAIHWWNPFYWLAAARFRSLREQACDAFVVRRIDREPIASYSALLLRLVERQPTSGSWRVMLPASILGFFPSAFRRRPIRTRLKALRTAAAVPNRWQTAVAASLILLFAVGGLTDARDSEESMDIPTWMAQHPDVDAQLKARQQSYIKQPTFDGPRFTRTYGIKKILDRISQTEPNRNDAQAHMEGVLKLMFRATNDLNARSGALGKTPAASPTPPNTAPTSTGAGPSQMSYAIRDNTLTVDAPEPLHERLTRILEAWADAGLSQFTVQTRFIRFQRDIIADLGVSFESIEAFSPDLPSRMFVSSHDTTPVVRGESRVDVYQPVVVAALDETQLTKLVDFAQSDRRTNILSAPTVTFFNGQDCTIADCTQRPFVVGVTQSNPPGANQPKIVVIDEGTKINLRCSQTRDRKKVHVQGNFEFSAVAEVSTATMRLNGDPVTVQIPHVNRNTLEVVHDIAPEHTLLVGFLPTDNKPDCLYLLLTPKIAPRNEK